MPFKATLKIILSSVLFFSLVLLTSALQAADNRPPLLPKSKDGNEVVQVDYSKVIARTKPEAIRGVNMNNGMVIAKVMDKVKRMKVTTLSYPAGNIADEKDCNTGADFSYFSLQQSMLGSPFTFIQVRLFDGTPELAVQSIINAASNDVRADVWLIGNEPDLYPPSYAENKVPEWTISQYNQAFRDFALKMKAFKPEIKLAGPVVSQPKSSWIESFITENGDLFDVLAWHWYPSDGTWTDEKALKSALYIRDQIREYKSWLKDPKINPKGYKKDYKLALTEFAIHADSSNNKHLTDMISAMWVAEVMAYLAMDGIDYSHYFCMGAYGGHAIFENLVNTARPVYYVYNLLANRTGTNWMNTLTSDDKIKAFGTTDGDKMKYLLLINQNQDAKFVDIELKGMKSPAKSVKQLTLSASDNGGAKLEVSDVVPTDNLVQLVVLPYTVNAFEIN